MLGLPKSTFPSTPPRPPLTALSDESETSKPNVMKVAPPHKVDVAFQPLSAPGTHGSPFAASLSPDLPAQPSDEACPQAEASPASPMSSAVPLPVLSKRVVSALGKANKAALRGGSKKTEAEAAGWMFERSMLLKRLTDMEQQVKVREALFMLSSI